MNKVKVSMSRLHTCKLFNGYVQEPVTIAVLAIIPAIVSLVFALWATWDFCFAETNLYTEVQECIIDKYRKNGTNYELVSSLGATFCLPVDSVANSAVLDGLVEDNSGILVEYSVKRESEEHFFYVTAISHRDGTVIISRSEIEDVGKTKWVNALIWLWGIFVVYIALLLGANHVLCNAPKYPRLACLLIREQWRNF